MLNTGNLEAVDELFAPDYIAHVPLDLEPVRGAVALKQRLTTYLAAFPDLHVTLEDLVVEKIPLLLVSPGQAPNVTYSCAYPRRTDG